MTNQIPSGTPSFRNWARNSLMVGYPSINESKAVNKWKPVIGGDIDTDRIGSETINKICVYLELACIYEDLYVASTTSTKPIGYQLLTELWDELKDSINNSPDRRVGIVRKVYNYGKNQIEYELEDGNFVGTDEILKPKKFETSSLPDNFLNIFEPDTVRERKLNQLI